MKNSACSVCLTPFDKPIENKLYCSNACKQLAYEKRKKEKEGLSGTEVIEEIKTPEVKYKIDYYEYAVFLNMLTEKKQKDIFNFMDITVYSFFRKNLTGEKDMPFIYEYITNFLIGNDYLEYMICQDEYHHISVNNCKILVNQYNDFLKLYHTGQVEIINSKNL